MSQERVGGGRYPMIALPNALAVAKGAPATLDVYRAWTQRDVVRAVEGVVHPKIGLNTGELERAVRQIVVGKDWAAVKGDWTPGRGDRLILQWAVDGEYQDKLNQLRNNLRDYYHRHADFSKIHECKQVADGLYHQQLKIAFLSGMRPDISQTIKKTLIGWGIATMIEVK
ncbi:unnamed protein product, partial [Coregonus sp. 'balchen']